MTVMVLQGDAIERLRELPADSVHCCITSPPYWGLRDYQTGTWEGGEAGCDHKADIGARASSGLNGSLAHKDGRIFTPYRDLCGKCGARRIDQQIGLEPTPEAWAAKLVEVFREVRRVLRPDGVCFVNVGDSYAAGKMGRDDQGEADLERRAAVYATGRPKAEAQGNNGVARKAPPGLKSKDLVGQPWLLAFALRADGWWLRSEIIWAKPNPMPESVTDRPTKAHEQVFLLAKSGEATFWLHRDLPGVRSRPEPDYRWIKRKLDPDEPYAELTEDPGDSENWKRINLWRGRDYFYDAEAVREANSETPGAQAWRRIFDPSKQGKVAELKANGFGGGQDGERIPNPAGRNLRSVWQIATEPFPEAHFATFPAELARRCILAGTSAKGCCPACGAPWARVVERGEARQVRWAPGPDKHTIAVGGKGATSAMHTGIIHDTVTLGWRPSCACDAGEPVPCTVLDCFGGSGTTGLVADQLGRDAILIELSPDYAAMAERRIAKARARRMLGSDAARPEPLPGQLGLAL